ncbi:MAG: hypothetical protein QOI21_2027 [Actinomycetota bacterium]|jgi:hypothetical protein|nr:hypothetical protein [Actinomycetota bacterium]
MNREGPAEETHNPWTIVNVVFHYLAEQGLHPTFSTAGDPGIPAAEMLRAFGITPTADGDARIRHEVTQHLAELRAAILEDE